MTNHDPERAYVQSMIEATDIRHAAVIESLRTDVDRLRDSWAVTYAEQRRASEERIAAIQADTREWIKGLYAEDGDDGAHTDVRQIPQDASSLGAPVPPGAGSAGPPTDPHAAELAKAERIRTMPMDLWAEERQRLVRSNQGMF